jgi:lysophospholipase L1-like esterase
MGRPLRRTAVAAATTAVAVALSACTGPSAPGSASGDASPEPPSYSSYVALGDSFTSGPFIPTTDLADGCLRSNRNYPSLVADALEVDDFTDVSCSGAETGDLTSRQSTFRSTTVPPQLRALDRDTDLVTLGIGGNDLDLFSTLVGTCARAGLLDPQGSPCRDMLAADGVDLDARTERIGARVTGVLDRIARRAPGATVLLVGYPSLTPETGRCRKRLPLARGDYPLARRLENRLNEALRSAADRAGVDFVDVRSESDGHDICSGDPWVNGQVTERGKALAFHPFAEGMARLE